MIPDRAGILPALGVLPFWLIAAGATASIIGLSRMLLSGVQQPFAHARDYIVGSWPSLLAPAMCIVISGTNLIAFMWIKPLLNYMVPFSADPLLANFDHTLFLGRDPWSLLTWMNSSPAAIFYHRGWFFMMIITLLLVAKSPPSAKKSALMLSYFALWSVVGPLIHVLLPAAGPVFYARLGYGGRFTGLQGVPETQLVADYLWQIYSGKTFGPGSGISAMPSMHVATTTWMMMSAALLAPRWAVPMALAGIAIFLLSVSLGWHYATDGIVGALAAASCYATLKYAYEAMRRIRRSHHTPASVRC
jgi:hypothetical protein